MLGEIIGSTAAGTNSVRVPGGFHVTFTGTKVLKHDGGRHHGVGVAPTIPVRRTVEASAARSDEGLLKALEAVGSSVDARPAP